ncbi:hypothetical protein [Priestia megaterium]|uniref:hypothetical protein n=1 Tax=Priestia megaterium TaxID=1404 RepID=UPI0015AF3B41|nr:hypothetical protein [Priestia megaterium]QLC85409.1 hypothetical protein HW576_02265 [Priestia megaterium]
MEDTKENEKTVKININYMIILVIIAFVFSYVSCVALLGRSTDLNDVYVSFCAILGGLVGGLITLEGVKRTILAQREITLEGVKATIEAQREQEALKLIPQKIVALHKLDRKVSDFFVEVSIKIGGWAIELKVFEKDSSLSVSDKVKIFLTSYEEANEFYLYKLKDREYEFIEIVSQIDIDLYKIIKSSFDELEQKLNETLLRKSNLSDVYYDYCLQAVANKGEELDFKEDFHYENFSACVINVSNELEESEQWLSSYSAELKLKIDEKLEQYGKEIL